MAPANACMLYLGYRMDHICIEPSFEKNLTQQYQLNIKESRLNDSIHTYFSKCCSFHQNDEI